MATFPNPQGLIRVGDNLVNLITSSSTYQQNARVIDANARMFNDLLATRK